MSPQVIVDSLEVAVFVGSDQPSSTPIFRQRNCSANQCLVFFANLGVLGVLGVLGALCAS